MENQKGAKMTTFKAKQPTIGVLPGWEVYENANLVNYLGPLLHGIRLAALDLQCNLLIACGIGEPGGQMGAVEPAWPVYAPESQFIPVGPFNTDGLIVINPMIIEERIAYVKGLAAAGHKIVHIGTALGGAAIALDNQNSIRQAAAHLIQHGHRQIAFIAGSPDDMPGDTGERLEGYRQALAEHRLAYDPRLVAYGFHVVEGGRLAMQQILKSGVTFTAVLGSSDECAIGAVQALKEKGYRIPEDVAVIGFDDLAEALVQEPPLTTMRSPTSQRGYKAVELLLQYIQGKKQEPEIVAVPARLIIRQSCGCSIRTTVNWQEFSKAHADEIHWQGYSPLVYAMAEAVLSASYHLGADETRKFCLDLVSTLSSALHKGQVQDFYWRLEDILLRVQTIGDEIHAWLDAISLVKDALPALFGTEDSLLFRQAEIALYHAAEMVGDAIQRQRNRSLLDQTQTTTSMAVLTSHLMAAMEESKILAVLGDQLPEMGIPHAGLVFYEPENEDPVAWSNIRPIPVASTEPYRYRSRVFPPLGIYPVSEPYSLALVPLVLQERVSGFVAFDTARLELYGAIVQQLSSAIRSAQLHREAEEGRRLAETADQLKSRFLSTVSHELRTPLGAIIGISEMALNEADKSEVVLPIPYLTYLKKIYTNAAHLNSLISDVLDLARNQAGQLRLICEPLNLRDVFEAVIVVGEQLALDKNLTWRVEIPKTFPPVWGDPVRLRQVFINLINNACKFTSQGEVCLRAEIKNEQIIVSVSDTGIGIPLGEQKIIFDEFRQTERTARRGYGGLGLGLAICQKLVILHGGTIHVESEGEEGAGSTFTISLPIMIRENDEKEDTPILPGQSILVLSSQSGSGEVLGQRLSQRGIRVEVINTESDWMRHVSEHPWRAIILDMDVKAEQGWEIIGAIKENSLIRDVPILFYSLSLEQDSGSLLPLDYLKKPVGTPELEKALQKQGFWEKQSGKKILVVDDDSEILELHTRVVQQTSAAFQVLQAEDGLQALEIIHKQKPDLVLLDLLMPELDGFGVIEAMQKDKSLFEIPVIVLTGQALNQEDIKRLNHGVAAIVSKGIYSVEETLHQITNILENTSKFGGEKRRLARQAAAYIHEHFAESLNRDEIARYLGVNEDHLSRCFHQEMGMNMMVYLRRYRIHRAKAMLADREKNVTEIALAVGFQDSNYFARVFRQETGQTPSAYRRS